MLSYSFILGAGLSAPPSLCPRGWIQGFLVWLGWLALKKNNVAWCGMYINHGQTVFSLCELITFTVPKIRTLLTYFERPRAHLSLGKADIGMKEHFPNRSPVSLAYRLGNPILWSLVGLALSCFCMWRSKVYRLRFPFCGELELSYVSYTNWEISIEYFI